MTERNIQPPSLKPIDPLISNIPSELLPWIAEKHVQYLDDRIHQIDRLTDYLAHCDHVKSERLEFIQFVDACARLIEPDLEEYLADYASRFRDVREQVDSLCDRVMSDSSLWQNRKTLLAFWQDFAYINEVDSLHGMFLTSGRWYVNVMLPVVKELVYCSLPDDLGLSAEDRNDMAYHVSRRVITPRYAQVPLSYDNAQERRFAKLFIPVLQHFDRKLLFLFEAFTNLPYREFPTLTAFVMDVSDHQDRYESLLQMGVYPPFGWHELHASRRARRSGLAFGPATESLLNCVPARFLQRAQKALNCLTILKEYELNYNNYNYKGRFGLISKYQYWRTAQLMEEVQRTEFFDAILLDNFYTALEVVERATIKL